MDCPLAPDMSWNGTRRLGEHSLVPHGAAAFQERLARLREGFCGQTAVVCVAAKGFGRRGRDFREPWARSWSVCSNTFHASSASRPRSGSCIGQSAQPGARRSPDGSCPTSAFARTNDSRRFLAMQCSISRERALPRARPLRGLTRMSPTGHERSFDAPVPIEPRVVSYRTPDTTIQPHLTALTGR